MSAEVLFDALAARPPEAPVLTGDSQAWGAVDLLDAIQDLSSRLNACRTLAVLADNSPAWVMADLAALRAEIAHLPLPAFFSPEQLAHALNQSSADTVLTDQPERISALHEGFGVTGQWQGLSVMQRAVSGAALPRGTAKVSFTSGSTGHPKGVCLSAAGLVDTAVALSTRLGDLSIQRHLATLPLGLLLENVAGVYAPLLLGAAIHLPGLASLGWQGMAGFDAAALQAAVNTTRPHSMILVPELLKAWTTFLSASGQHAAPGLAYVAVGGARVDAALLSRARNLGLPVYQGYGLTECGSVVSLNRPGDDGDDVGRPLDHVAIRIENGEVVISARAFLGYIGGEPFNHETGESHPVVTGDLGHVDGPGHLHLSGRRKNLLISSYGRNISPEWVEAALLAQPAIAQAVVAGDDRPWLGALVVPAPGVDVSGLAAAIDQANATLPDYARVGGWIAASPFTLRNGQATGNGRPVRTAILSQYATPLAALYSLKEPAHVVL